MTWDEVRSELDTIKKMIEDFVNQYRKKLEEMVDKHTDPVFFAYYEEAVKASCERMYECMYEEAVYMLQEFSPEVVKRLREILEEAIEEPP